MDAPSQPPAAAPAAAAPAPAAAAGAAAGAALAAAPPLPAGSRSAQPSELKQIPIAVKFGCSALALV